MSQQISAHNLEKSRQLVALHISELRRQLVRAVRPQNDYAKLRRLLDELEREYHDYLDEER